MDDISARYFRHYHPHLPIISRTRFYKNLITLGTSPAADFSALLLSLCLVTYAPASGCPFGQDGTPAMELQHLYLTVRSIFAQVQVTCSPSVYLIQAGLIIALFEYTRFQPENAFATIASVVRMAYAARIHLNHSDQDRARVVPDQGTMTDLLQENEEAANTWWGIVIYERYVRQRSQLCG